MSVYGFDTRFMRRLNAALVICALLFAASVGALVMRFVGPERPVELPGTVSTISRPPPRPDAPVVTVPAPVVTQAELDGYARLGLTSEEQQRVTRILSVERAAVMKAFAGPEAGRRERVRAVALAAEEDLRRELGDRYEAYARARLDRLAGLTDGGAP